MTKIEDLKLYRIEFFFFFFIIIADVVTQIYTEITLSYIDIT